MAEKSTESILTIDCGSSFTKAALVEKVEGQFRFVANGEALTTPENLIEGLGEAVRDIEAKAGRRLLGDSGLIMPEGPDGSGADAAVMACSAGRPIRLIGAGISPSQALADASKVAASAVAELVATFSVQDIRQKSRGESKAAEMAEVQADALLFSAGQVDGDNPLLDELGGYIARTSLIAGGSKFPVLFAGGPRSSETLGQALGAVTDLQMVGPIRTASGSLQIQRASMALNDLYLNRAVVGLPGSSPYARDKWSAVMSAPKAIENVARFVAAQLGTEVTMLDLGSTTTMVVHTANGHLETEISANCGMGPGIHRLLAGAGADEACKWLPFSSDPEKLLELGLNKGLRPQTVPQLVEELLMEEAVARVAVQQAMKRAAIRSGLFIACGGYFCHLPNQGRLMLILLDAVQPVGITRIAFDPLAILPSLGAMAAAFPQAAGEVIMSDALTYLGTVVPLSGRVKTNQLAANIKVRFAEGGDLQVEVPFGGLEVIPLQAGRKATLLIQPTPEIQVGENPKGRRAEVEVEGGLVGVVVDARGRPLDLPGDPGQRMSKLADWLDAMTL